MSRVTLYFAPNTRALGAMILLEELGADYQLEVLDIRAGQQRRPEYLAINPMGKVPAVVHDGALVTEQGAIFIYLADLFPEAELAPSIGDPLRGPYLRWLVYYGSCFEPAIMDASQKREPGPASSSPYGDFDTVMKTLADQLSPGPWLLGNRITAADVLWGTALNWVMHFGLVPDSPVFRDYVARYEERPAVKRAREKNAAIAAEQPEP